MAEARREGQRAPSDAENSGKAAAEAIVRQSAAEVERQTEQLAAKARDGMRQAGAASAAGADAALRSGSAITQGVQEITTAWARYAEEVMRQTSEASRALMSCRSFSEMLEVQARLLRGNLQVFLDQSTKIADIAGRMAARPFEAVREAGTEQTRR
jgi:hypothetical protein